MEKQNLETPEKKRKRREELYRVIEKIRNTPVQNNEGPADKKQHLNPKQKEKKRCQKALTTH